jgi:hypothetical protein
MSANSINDIAIKLGIDATGVATGMKHATAEMLRTSREAEKAEQVERETNIKQMLDALDDANKARMKSEEAFQKWYAQTLEEEFQTWYQIELRKEKEAQAFAVNRQQAAINQANARANVAQPMGSQTVDRYIHNDELRFAITERYRLLDEAGQREQRLAIAQARDRKRLADDTLRQMINNANAEQQAAERASRFGTLRNDQLRQEQTTRNILKTIRHQQNAIAQREHAVQVQNNADIAAATQLVQRHLTVQERYAQELAKLTRLQHTYNLETGRALLTDQQVARAKTALTIATVRQQQAMMRASVGAIQTRNAFGGMSMAMGQASYAAEDFIQVMSMGGGLNMALMSASNNLSMVVRALAGTSGAMAAVAGFAVPVVLISIGTLIRGLMKEEEQANKTADALRNTADAVDELFDAHDRQYKHQNALDEIRRIETMEGIMNRINQQEKERNDLLQEQERLEAKLAALREKAASATGADTHLDSLLNDVAEYIRHDYEDILNMSIPEGLLDSKLAELKQAYNMLNWEIANGTEEGIIAAAERYKSILDNYATYFGDDRASKAYNKVSGLLKEEDALKAIKDAYGEAAAGQEEINNILKQIEDAEKQRIEIADTIARQQADALKAAQEEYLLKLRMTEAEREAYDLRKAQEEFMGPAAHGLMGMGGGPMDAIMQQALEQQNEAARMSFLEGQRDALRKDLDALVPEIIVKAGLEQNAMDAQAKAFEQMQQASAKKPNPQIERTNKYLESIDTAIKNGGRIEFIQ